MEIITIMTLLILSISLIGVAIYLYEKEEIVTPLIVVFVSIYIMAILIGGTQINVQHTYQCQSCEEMHYEYQCKLCDETVKAKEEPKVKLCDECMAIIKETESEDK